MRFCPRASSPPSRSSSQGSPEEAAQPAPQRSTPTALRGAKVVYLTFDDGPARPYTDRVLALLARYDARATFFAVGSELERQPHLARRIARAGHALGNHTYTHADLTGVSASRFASEVDRTQALIRRITGKATRLLRPPFGAVNAAVRSLAARRGYRIALWDVDPQDWRGGSAAAIAGRIVAAVRPGSVVLLHDGGGNRSASVAALAQVFERLAARGYTFEAMR